MNSIKRDKVAHAILLAGPRGVGKTSIARIIAKCLNCEKGLTPTPCLACSNCVEIAQGTSLAVREIDGASHNSVDNVRELIDTFRSLPAPGSRYKVYIIDEVHMLSVAAFNALLKSLEEPPPHTVFILATTEVHKIPETVISRCQRHDLRSLNADAVESQLRKICDAEKLAVEEGVFGLIGRLAEGSMRDAQSLLDRVQAFSDGSITLQATASLLGLADKRVLFGLSEAIFSHDSSRALELVDEIFSTGIDANLLLREYALHFREILVAKFGGDPALIKLRVPQGDRVELLRQVTSQSPHDVQDLVAMAREGADSASRSLFPRHALEALVVRMAERQPVTDLGELIAHLRAGERIVGESPRSATPVRGVATPVAPKAESRSSAPSSSARGGWGEFVRHVTENGGRIVAEHLKRLSLLRFENQILELKGPEFSVSSLKGKDAQGKLQAFLETFTGKAGWQILLHASDRAGTPEPGSLSQVESAERDKSRKEKEGEIARHTQIQKLQKAFPGSKIEGIKIKDA